MKKKVALLFVFAFGLILLRWIYTDHLAFHFMIWNLFLAWLPCCFIGYYQRSKNVYIKSVLLVLTILFLPNAPYMMTDLFHIRKTGLAPLWLDVLLILSFAVLGLFFFVFTVRIIMHAFPRPGKFRSAFKWLIMLLNAYGIYLGRYQRFNSWDVFMDPVSLARFICRAWEGPLSGKEQIYMILTFTVFLYVVYGIYEEVSAGQEGRQNPADLRSPSVEDSPYRI